jgi:alkylation response protein AidB-like acyl-CoA dehydrogenase
MMSPSEGVNHVNLELSEDQEFFRSTARKFLEAEVPLTTVRALYESADGFDREWWKLGAELGWTSMFAPESHGGGSLSGGPAADLSIVAEEMGRLVSPGPLVPVNLVVAALADAELEGAVSELVLGVLPGLLAGDSIATWAFCEPGQRWEISGLESTAVVEGNEVVLDGVKSYVEAASVADHFLVTARAEGGHTQVLVPAGTEGLQVIAGRSIDMTRRFGTVRLSGVRVPVSHIVGDPGGADKAVARQMSIALCLQCAEMCGVADRMLETTIEYGRDRFAFSRPIVSFQALKHRIADMTVRLEGSKAVTDALTASIDSRSGAAPKLASVAKAYVGEVCLDVVDDCVQITGGIGVTWEHDLHLYSRRAAVDRAVFGTPEEHKEKVLQYMLEDEGVRI